MAKKQSVDKHFVSSIDKKLDEFNRKHKPSAAQQAEIDKYQRIYALRDDPKLKRQSEEDDIWDDESS